LYLLQMLPYKDILTCRFPEDGAREHAFQAIKRSVR
jgi:hypothetical protein